ncbi:MAG: hypothetical protein K6E72_12025 [Saccharofermentans sp.]|jgi:hypothetical protein|nr:hypothetical protein [Saccharofermentans sp.]
MDDWKDYSNNQIVKIERLAQEFEVWELKRIPYGKMKIRIYESQNGNYMGRTNLMVKDSAGSYNPGIGHGQTVVGALDDTINDFFSQLDNIIEIKESDFQYVDPMDF